MSIKLLLAAACIALAIWAAVIEEPVLFGPLEWIVLSIAFSLLPLEYRVGGK